MEYFDEQKELLRQEAQLQKLGSDKPVCCLCGYADPTGLIKADKTLLEKHHLAGRHEGPTVLVCRNCHAELTDVQQSDDKRFNSPDRTPLVTAAAFLEGLANFFKLLAITLTYLANWLFNLDVKIDEGIYSDLPFHLGGGVISG